MRLLNAQIEADLAGFPADYWTNEAFHDRYDRGSVEALRYLGMPNWFIRAAFGLRALNLGLRRLAGHLARLFRA
jgi:hypothetical protein